jgi:aspartyl-tRNA(Asn)/glutamyl-tRNA(Gln) amidotransferase subunit A
MAETALWQLAASELIAGYARRVFSPVEVVDEVLARVESLNPRLNAYLAVGADDARAAAKAAETRWLAPGEKPVLCGVPVSVKDLIEVRGMPTTYGSLAFKDNYQDDAELVRRLRQAGAIIVGKTNTPEFGMLAGVRNRLGDDGRNPWNREHTCGGSSGGSAAAVAVGLGPVAVGTDSGGSVRLPAAYNGIFGFKPTYQRIPAVQKWRGSPTRSHNGTLSRTVRDSALVLQAVAGHDRRDPNSDLGPTPDFHQFAVGAVRGARVAVSYDLGHLSDVQPAARRAAEAAADLLREHGCTLVEADPPRLEVGDRLESGVWAYAGDQYAGLEALIPGFLEKHADDLTDYARPMLEGGPRALAWEYRRVLGRHQAYIAQVKEWFEAYDYLLTPAPGPAPRLGEVQAMGSGPGRLHVSFVVPFSMAQTPAATVPFGFDPGGLPVAVQIVGRHRDDVGVLRMAAAIEATQPWGQHWPALAQA